MLRTFLFTLAAAAVLAAGAPARADQMSKHAPTTITGEVVDMGCWLGHSARGAKHVECATKCIQGGMPMGLLTDKGVLYLLTLSHDDADPYNKIKDMAGKTVSVTGSVMTRSGVKGIDVTAFKPAEAVGGK
ncbi:MAG: hypothetical protein HZB25_13250 [Candidatus Eisenbacteria bacterium]|nr:hypothetical protein [Candidatus Eisenbacteria bacterium]